MRIIAAMLVIAALTGCAYSGTLTEDEREFRRDYNQLADRANWDLCERSIIRNSFVYVVHDHNGRRHRQGDTRADINMIRDDLSRNKCHIRIGDDRWIARMSMTE